MALPPDSLMPEVDRSLQRARQLLAVQGSPVLRAQAQQQAALELLQARKHGAGDQHLEAVLLEEIRNALARMLQHSASQSGAQFPTRPFSGSSMEQRVAIFLQAETELWILSAPELDDEAKLDP
jgi:hypothetical protein